MRWIDADEMEKNVEDMIAYDLDGALQEIVDELEEMIADMLYLKNRILDIINETEDDWR